MIDPKTYLKTLAVAQTWDYEDRTNVLNVALPPHAVAAVSIGLTAEAETR